MCVLSFVTPRNTSYTPFIFACYEFERLGLIFIIMTSSIYIEVRIFMWIFVIFSTRVHGWCVHVFIGSCVCVCARARRRSLEENINSHTQIKANTRRTHINDMQHMQYHSLYHTHTIGKLMVWFNHRSRMILPEHLFRRALSFIKRKKRGHVAVTMRTTVVTDYRFWH